MNSTTPPFGDRRRNRLARFNRRVTNRLIDPIADRIPGYAIVQHTGRRSGRMYRTPVGVTWRGNRVFVALNYGTGCDWVRNVAEAGVLRIDHRRASITLRDPRIVHIASRPFLTATVVD